ncbi:MAG: hypothetical protein IJT59_08080 [Desulfovibrionaceae bacterium]|nr:hypothetical protein [Desulfovibrionaceae bacterium]
MPVHLRDDKGSMLWCMAYRYGENRKHCHLAPIRSSRCRRHVSCASRRSRRVIW